MSQRVGHNPFIDSDNDGHELETTLYNVINGLQIVGQLFDGLVSNPPSTNATSCPDWGTANGMRLHVQALQDAVQHCINSHEKAGQAGTEGPAPIATLANSRQTSRAPKPRTPYVGADPRLRVETTIYSVGAGLMTLLEPLEQWIYRPGAGMLDDELRFSWEVAKGLSLQLRTMHEALMDAASEAHELQEDLKELASSGEVHTNG